ncbi:hypothetical protein L1787_04345 [Acuticoccus sp. M5D2P5]|uniref:hypothetical protein n=1 Tax=Acuticoccus kalidii TaxID=2910977 RepID=UPI001F290E81|nr:hypothetical protein [Acuticoccus kalidii]MCF3932646.1 hypothetical protein [Acuticoccus kalidii]
MAINIVQNGGADLSSFDFTLSSDVGIAKNVVTEPSAFSYYTGLTNAVQETWTWPGFDLISGTLQASGETDGDASFVGFEISQILNTGWDADIVRGRLMLEVGGENSGFQGAGLRLNEQLRPSLDVVTLAPDPIETEPLLVTGRGSDIVSGIATGTNAGGPEAVLHLVGIANGSTIDLGQGSDLLVASASGSVEAGSAGLATVVGLGQLYDISARAPGPTSMIEAGAGHDTILATASVDGEIVSLSYAVAITSHQIDMGNGFDRITARASMEHGDNANLSSVRGIEQSEIDTGAQNDVVKAMVDADGGANSSASGTTAIGSTTITTGTGNDRVIAATSLDVGDFSEVSSITAIDHVSMIETGEGNDRVVAKLDIDVGASAAADQSAALGGSVSTGAGDDLIFAKLSLDGDAESITSSSAAIRGGESQSIHMGEGRDTLIAKADIDNPDGELGFAAGIVLATIDMGADNDTVIAKGASTVFGANLAPGSGSYGIVDSTLQLGDGDDLLIARGASGGIYNTTLFGGSGDDEFDIGSGFGTVDGGTETDLLVLAGNMEDFMFEAGMSVFTGHITGDGTELLVADVELFEFDDGIYSYAELFGIDPV